METFARSYEEKAQELAARKSRASDKRADGARASAASSN
jgi:hypothetical protein